MERWEKYPHGLHKLLLMIKKKCGNYPVYISENGTAFEDVLTKNRALTDA